MTHNRFHIRYVCVFYLLLRSTLPRKRKTPLLFYTLSFFVDFYYFYREYRSKNISFSFSSSSYCALPLQPLAIHHFIICFFQFATLVIANVAESRLCGTGYFFMVALLPIRIQHCTVPGRDRARECLSVFLSIILLRCTKYQSANVVL